MNRLGGSTRGHSGTAGQSLTDRVMAAKHRLTGQGLAKSVYKATTEEALGPKPKHVECKRDESQVSCSLWSARLRPKASHEPVCKMEWLNGFWSICSCLVSSSSIESINPLTGPGAFGRWRQINNTVKGLSSFVN